MSTQRNSSPQPSRGRNVAAVIGAIVAPIAAMIAACSGDSVTNPVTSSVSGPARTARAPLASIAPAPKPKPSPTDSANHETLAQLAAQAPTWHTQPADKEAGTDKPLPLACGVAGTYSVGRVIGPAGGTLSFGRSSLTIPAGALSSNVTISATITLGSSVTVEFAPHGLQFAKAATMVVNYTGCTAPSNTALDVYYTDVFGGIMQSMPTASNPAQQSVTALTDHFSGYTVAWGRTGSSFY